MAAMNEKSCRECNFAECLFNWMVAANCVGGKLICWRINLITDLCGSGRDFMAPELLEAGKLKEFGGNLSSTSGRKLWDFKGDKLRGDLDNFIIFGGAENKRRKQAKSKLRSRIALNCRSRWINNKLLSLRVISFRCCHDLVNYIERKMFAEVIAVHDCAF